MKKTLIKLSLIAFLGATFNYFFKYKPKNISRNVMNKEYCNINKTEQIKTIEDLANLFISNPDDVKKTSAICKQELEENLQKILESGQQESFVAYDKLFSNFSKTHSVLQILEMVSPSEEVRNSCHAEQIALAELYNKRVAYNKDVYQKLKKAEVKPSLSYSLKSVIDEFETNGINLPDDKREKLAEIINQITKISAEYSFAINQDTPEAQVTEDEKNNLKDSVANIINDNKIILTPPNYMIVMQQANNESLRKKCWQAFLNKSPQNEVKLKELIKLRDQLAKNLNFENFAAYDIHNQMAKKPETVKDFLNKLIKPLQDKAETEFKYLKDSLPQDVILNNDKFKPWDVKYAQENYRKQYLNIDQEEISKYFEAEKTLNALLHIYEDFLNIKFKLIKYNNLFWHQDIKILELYENNKLSGYILLDLYPREFKYSHACQATIIPAYKDNLSAALVIANFPKPEKDKPSLLQYKDVVTFFHEFGHALHAMLGRTEIAAKSGTNVAMDFVEMPSQMLEEWLKEKNVLKLISSHYQTGQKISDETISALANMEKTDAGFNYLNQLYFALLSLTLFEKDEIDFQKHSKDLFTKVINKIEFVPNNFLNSFGHLTGYGSKYYGYLWAKVFALDIFDTIKANNFNQEIGQKYKDVILRPGGTIDPAILINQFLDREPNQNAFLKSLGI